MNTTLTLRQVAAILGGNLGDVIKLRTKDCRHFDPTFPPMVHGEFDREAILKWQAANVGKTLPTTAPNKVKAP